MHSHDAAVAAARALAADTRAESTGWFWLDGSAAPEGESRVSYLGRASEVLTAEAGREHEFLDTLRSISRERCVSRERSAPATDMPSEPRFTSGWVVAFGYEFGVGLLCAPHTQDTVAPAFALRVDGVVAIHHGTSAGLSLPQPAPRPGRQPAPASASTASPPAWRSNDAKYLRQVEACREAISAGDAYVLCLTDSAEVVVSATIDPLDLYRELSGNGSVAATRGGVIATPGRQLVSASPERFLTVRGRHVATHPIKGTRPRGADARADALYAEDLAHDPKERAENLMIVDLMRNDLSLVCDPGSVRVARFLDVETHPRVHQLVSTVTGELAQGRDAFDAIAACFPGGSMTGAPKRSAVAILGALEAGPRGLYAGCFGWIDDGGEAELAMTIRGIEMRPDASNGTTQLLVGAGGGITADSVPDRELHERDVKAQAMLAAIDGASR